MLNIRSASSLHAHHYREASRLLFKLDHYTLALLRTNTNIKFYEHIHIPKAFTATSGKVAGIKRCLVMNELVMMTG